ncbi:phosphatidylglycerophosphatase A family protein [Peloplasma aerotolerans]|jgi:phosphatidylglycerophosphatase A|uniref:Phosphatidylglycerophosphatase A n=1 Tax=Peloplasma aerotolerans TaxID=3044389 RepID=A0AAW6U6D0_9MOLU|nr:phosphatidylglycerophosphatase A [Mariniplasma sp. M4Ah]MDI6453405.1 phosphatidylglycerophosphatase A [Mariniplasma sp. M4Ah]MDR4969120.1 phosphatidylglycerophosphatase A [Acholeplasmataceae bacterium]
MAEKKAKKLLFTRQEMFELNKKVLLKRGVSIEAIAEISFQQQSKYTDNITRELCQESVEKILSLRDVFHHVQLAAEIDRLAEQRMFQGPIQDIILEDLGLFGIDETMGLDVAGLYGTIGQTNFGDIDVNKHGIVKRLNDAGKEDDICHTFLDDIVGAIAAAASTRVAQVTNEEIAHEDVGVKRFSIFDL